MAKGSKNHGWITIAKFNGLAHTKASRYSRKLKK